MKARQTLPMVALLTVFLFADTSALAISRDHFRHDIPKLLGHARISLQDNSTRREEFERKGDVFAQHLHLDTQRGIVISRRLVGFGDLKDFAARSFEVSPRRLVWAVLMRAQRSFVFRENEFSPGATVLNVFDAETSRLIGFKIVGIHRRLH